ncbi:methylated-DNA--[protein]-cysteine S-methyltransferase [Pseudofrancisella aestuarii]|uniref:Methylated-DNA--protein-cysteine methyltransferase n=1 Tax=Pseudofrancisella aestuarii TaxID=2670347 RepID=A0ABV9TEL5_9GAMM|nr:methylated-DNA--[protein]-cysteine S-methyltransferase [Pseudofrancisella aestuarii]
MADVVLYSKTIKSPIGNLIAIANDSALLALGFGENNINQKLAKIDSKASKILEKTNKILEITAKELDLYFSGNLKKFTIPLKLNGTEFQKNAWKQLQQIPYGKTISYLDEAKNIGNEKAFRAVANANGKNNIPIIIPCHRVINSNGKLGGFTGGIEKKIWILKHESKFI